MAATTQAKDMSSAQLRKIKKPVIERRRRERINDSLNQLKSLLLSEMNKDETQYSKMEKADILEMAVTYLKGSQQQQQRAPLKPRNGDEVIRYRDGFKECAHEVTRYLEGVQGVASDVTCRLMDHLSQQIRPSSQTGNVTNTATPTALAYSKSGLCNPSATSMTSLPGFTGRVIMGPTHAFPQTPASNMVAGNTSSSALPLYVNATGLVYGLPVGCVLSPATSPKGSDYDSDSFRSTSSPELEHVPSFVRSCSVEAVSSQKRKEIVAASPEPVWRPW